MLSRYFGNHNKRKGDIVRIAKWDKEALANIKKKIDVTTKRNGLREFLIPVDELLFVIVSIDYERRHIRLDPTSSYIAGMYWSVHLDETNLIRVDRLT